MKTNDNPLEFPEKLLDGDHLIQFYKTDDFLTESITSFIAPALMNNEGAIIVATKIHLQQIEIAFGELKIKTPFFKSIGQLLIIDAEAVLAEIMVNDIPEAKHFKRLIEGPINEMSSKYSSVKVYGEMVDVLWSRNDIFAAIMLKKMWKELLHAKKITILCSYSIETLSEDLKNNFYDFCETHTKVIPAEGIINFGYQDQLKKIAELQFLVLKNSKGFNDVKRKSKEMILPVNNLKQQLFIIQEELSQNGRLSDSLSLILANCEDLLSDMNRIIEKIEV